MVGAVGDDAAAALVLAPLEDAGVDTSGVRRVPGGTTGTALVYADDDGENTIVVVAGANAVLGEDDVRRRAPTSGPATSCSASWRSLSRWCGRRPGGARTGVRAWC